MRSYEYACVCVPGSLSTKMFWNCFQALRFRSAFFCFFFFGHFCFSAALLLFKIFNFRINTAQNAKKFETLCVCPPWRANFLKLWLFIMNFSMSMHFNFVARRPRCPPLYRWWQSSGIDLWQRHCILLYLKEIFLEIGTRQRGRKRKMVKFFGVQKNKRKMVGFFRRATWGANWGWGPSEEVGVSKAEPFISVTPCRVANLALGFWAPVPLSLYTRPIPSCGGTVSTIDGCLCVGVCVWVYG